MKKTKSETGKNPARRTFIKQAGMSAAAALSLPALLSSCCKTGGEAGNIDEFFSDGDVILFPG